MCTHVYYIQNSYFIFQSHEKTHTCKVCGKSYSRRDVFTRHKKIHENQSGSSKKREQDDDTPKLQGKRFKITEYYECDTCGATFPSVNDLKEHFVTHKMENEHLNDNQNYSSNEDPLMGKALHSALKVITFHLEGIQKNDLYQFFQDREEDVANYLENETARTEGVKWHMRFAV